MKERDRFAIGTHLEFDVARDSRCPPTRETYVAAVRLYFILLFPRNFAPRLSHIRGVISFATSWRYGIFFSTPTRVSRFSRRSDYIQFQDVNGRNGHAANGVKKKCDRTRIACVMHVEGAFIPGLPVARRFCSNHCRRQLGIPVLELSGNR